MVNHNEHATGLKDVAVSQYGKAHFKTSPPEYEVNLWNDKDLIVN